MASRYFPSLNAAFPCSFTFSARVAMSSSGTGGVEDEGIGDSVWNGLADGGGLGVPPLPPGDVVQSSFLQKDGEDLVNNCWLQDKILTRLSRWTHCQLSVSSSPVSLSCWPFCRPGKRTIATAIVDLVNAVSSPAASQ